jgi:hypothetical protein
MLLDENGEPAIFKHTCDETLVGQQMSFENLHKFAVELLANLFNEGKNGMKIHHICTKFGVELPNLVIESVNGIIYYVAVSTGIAPKTSTPIYNNVLLNMVNLAKKNHARAALAEISFMNADNMFEQPKMGGNFFVKYDGLHLLETDQTESFIDKIKKMFK